jgi:6-phosphogluconolactonase
MTPDIIVAVDAEQLAEQAAARLTRAACEAVDARGVFHIALAGGSTPRRLYERLAADEGPSMPWSQTHVWFGDERTVGPDDDESNYRMVHDTLLRRVPVPAAQVQRMEGDREPDEAARRYEGRLRREVPAGAGGIPELDLVLLGLGADGHTASLFPGTSAIDETTRLVVAPYVDTLGTHRITLTYPTLNAAHAVLFLVAGEDKAEAVRAVLEPRADEPALPAARVQPDGSLVWLLDLAAAARLTRIS